MPQLTRCPLFLARFSAPIHGEQCTSKRQTVKLARMCLSSILMRLGASLQPMKRPRGCVVAQGFPSQPRGAEAGLADEAAAGEERRRSELQRSMVRTHNKIL